MTQELTAAICLMFEDLKLASFADVFEQSDVLVPFECLWDFITRVLRIALHQVTRDCLLQVRGFYHNVPYHNFFHCCDVAHATFRFIKLTEKRTGMSSLESFALMIASICHDMDHPGRFRTDISWSGSLCDRPLCVRTAKCFPD